MAHALSATLTDRRANRQRAGIAVMLGVIFHVGLGYAVYKSPVPDSTILAPVSRIEVGTFEADVDLQKPTEPPKPPEKTKAPEPEVLPDQPKPIETPKLEKIQPTEKKLEPKPQPAPAPRQPPRPKTHRPQKKAKKATKAAKKTVVLAKGLSRTSGPRVYEGDDDVFGSPEEGYNEDSARNDDGPQGNGPPNSKGTGGPAVAAPAPAAPGKPEKVVAPRVIKRVKGTYPAKAPRTGRPIPITMSLQISESGSVTSAKIVSKPSIAGTHFDAEAQRVVRKTRFKPARKGDTPIAFTIRYTVVFTP